MSKGKGATAKQLASSREITEKTVIGKETYEVDWKDGIRDFAVRLDNFTIIPWLLPHWLGEKQRRKQDILDWDVSRSFMGRALSLLKSDKKRSKGATVETTGQDIIAFLELKDTRLTDALKQDPTNSDLRMQLVRNTLDRLTKKTTPSIKQYRSLFLQALMTNCFGVVSTDSITLLKQVHDLYYRNIQKICKDRIENNQFASGDSPERAKEKEKTVAFTTSHLNIIIYEKKYFISKLDPVLNKSQARKFVLRIEDFKNWSPDHDDSDTVRKNLIAHSWEAVQMMRCFPLLHEEAQEFADLVMKIDPRNPIGIFMKGYIMVAEADLMIMAYRRGFKPKNRLEKIQSILRNVMTQYEHAVTFIGNEYSPANLNLLAEYANTVLFLHNLGTMGKTTPRPVLERYVKNARSLLYQAHKEKPTASVNQAIKKVVYIADQNGFKI